MAADPIIYCLEQLTDYDQFERLCHDAMSRNGYTGIEPLGGRKDKGRDALHRATGRSQGATVFAYSVREDWRDKLDEDCEKIRKHRHSCDQLVFLCTAAFTAGERDKAVQAISATYGWTLELYGLERLRVLIAADSALIAQHPQIFTPAFFPRAGGISLATSRDHLVLDYADTDAAFGIWLARRLTLAGYSVWCRSLAPIAGATISDTIEALMGSRAFRFLPVLSTKAISDPDLTARRVLASRTNELSLPVVAEPCDLGRLDARSRSLAPIRFDRGWAQGLAELLHTLENAGCPKAQGGEVIALRSFFPPGVVVQRPETLFSNRFSILTVPEVIRRFKSSDPLPPDRFDEIRHRWAMRKVDPQRFLAFDSPPQDLAAELGITGAGAAAWKHIGQMDGVSTANLIPELIRKAVLVALAERGLLYCPSRKVVYFPEGILKSERAYFTKPDGARSFVTVTGRRKLYRPGKSSHYRYHLAPELSVERAPDGPLYLTVRVRLRITDDDKNPLIGRTVNSRRKHLCKSWWNDEWFSRILAVIQFLADGQNRFEIGSGDAVIVISAVPDQWNAPASIDETALSPAETDASREDALTHAYDDAETSDD